ncbi:DUF4097 family beta strand repeat-containing protein [Thermococcus peptonophilus]|uniref:DUF4097 domain-containing protein n=1 Tax=Thermococcus peptonophilus TaxID=53952 RepID=A0A142CXG8_9EURY|nr:DUF4097 family beta strand repeat-containing protein [Thermococcus peptonophilus]AMQ19470.1 hypothetical protein A0127_10000 [Thermococcus peptonophilus]
MIFENVKEVDVSAVNGKVEIEGWENDHAEVSYTVHGDARVEINRRGGKLVIKEKPKKRFFNMLGKSGWAEIIVKVPRNVPVIASSVNGEIRARNVSFEKVSTVNGRIEVEDCKAGEISNVNGRVKAHLALAKSLKASSVNGPMEVEIEELEGNAKISTVNGSITLSLSDFCDARIRTSRVNGAVTFEGTDPENPVIGTGEFEVKVSTVNGNIVVRRIYYPLFFAHPARKVEGE